MILAAALEAPSLSRFRGRELIPFAGAAVFLKLVLLFVLAWNVRFVMDEFAQFGWAKYISNGIFDIAVHHPKAVGYAIFFKPAHLIGWDARSMLLIGRLQTALLACGTLAIIYALARVLGQNALRAMMIVLVLLSFSNFMERIFRTIAEPLAVFFAAASLLVAVRGPDRRRSVLGAGILTGLAFLTTQKSVYFNVGLGLALLGDGVLERRYRQAFERGAWLVLGWALPVVFYCLLFGGSAPVPVLKNLLFGPIHIAAHGADVYKNLSQYVVQTLTRNSLLYAFAISGMLLELLRIATLDPRTRIALIFSWIITLLVFAHNQPWPYVFVMALPFMSLWLLVPFDRLETEPIYRMIGFGALGFFILASFVRNFECLRIGNSRQLALVARAEALVGPNDRYFDGIGMLPNRREPSTLWLDRASVLTTLRQGEKSEAYQIFSARPPKVVIWSYRMDAIAPVVGSLIRDAYVQIAPNIRIAGRLLRRNERTLFDVPLAGEYELYDEGGRPVSGILQVNGNSAVAPINLPRGPASVTLRGARQPELLLLPQGTYRGAVLRGPDDSALFAGVYD